MTIRIRITIRSQRNDHHRPIVALLCVLCISVVQSGTVTVIEGNSPQRRRVHREDLDPQKDAKNRKGLDFVRELGWNLAVNPARQERKEPAQSSFIRGSCGLIRAIRVSSVALWMGGPLCPLCLCGSIRNGDCHRGEFTTETQSAQRRP